MLAFNRATRRQCVEIEIVEDTILEDSESFYVSLNTSDPAVVVHSESSTVRIIDNDSTFEEYCRSLFMHTGLRLSTLLAEARNIEIKVQNFDVAFLQMLPLALNRRYTQCLKMTE